MSVQILQFLKELQVNNNRDWFHENKARYDIIRKEYLETVQELINRIALFDPEIAGLEAKDCMFRIYRDIRFSPNKLPYKNHLGAYIAVGGKNSLRSGYYFHLEPGNSVISGGLWRPEPRLLKLLRQDMYDQMEEFIEIIEDPAFKAIYPALEGEKLKRMPAGYPGDFPHSELLLYKDFCLSNVVEDSFFEKENWLDEVVDMYKKQVPFHRFLNYTVDEFLGRV
ncbi:MAG: DUF2461 domain-containing protein [Tannerellaceae bacterium]|nr:DUF2461 domain-containing protein [Tannerellaceae bacterium]